MDDLGCRLMKGIILLLGYRLMMVDDTLLGVQVNDAMKGFNWVVCYWKLDEKNCNRHLTKRYVFASHEKIGNCWFLKVLYNGRVDPRRG